MRWWFFLQISKTISFHLLWLFSNNFFVDRERCRPGVNFIYFSECYFSVVETKLSGKLQWLWRKKRWELLLWTLTIPSGTKILLSSFAATNSTIFSVENECIWKRVEKKKFRNGLSFNLQAPVAQKIADEVVFRHFQGEGVEFF